MKVSRNKQTSFKVDDHVTIKISKVDKTTPLHPNVILGKIVGMENNYAIVVTKFGIISTYNPQIEQILFDYTKEVPFSSVSKKAVGRNYTHICDKNSVQPPKKYTWDQKQCFFYWTLNSHLHHDPNPTTKLTLTLTIS